MQWVISKWASCKQSKTTWNTPDLSASLAFAIFAIVIDNLYNKQPVSKNLYIFQKKFQVYDTKISFLLVFSEFVIYKLLLTKISLSNKEQVLMLLTCGEKRKYFGKKKYAGSSFLSVCSALGFSVFRNFLNHSSSQKRQSSTE